MSDGQWGKFGRIRCQVAFGVGMTVAYANSFPVLSVVSGRLAVGVTKEGN